MLPNGASRVPESWTPRDRGHLARLPIHAGETPAVLSGGKPARLLPIDNISEMRERRTALSARRIACAIPRGIRS